MRFEFYLNITQDPYSCNGKDNLDNYKEYLSKGTKTK